MAASRPRAQIHEKSNFICFSDASRRTHAAVPSSSESGTSSPQCKSPRFSSLQQSAVSINNVGKSARPATRKPVEKPAPRSHLPQRTAPPPPASSAKERESKTSSSMPRATTSSANTHALRKPIEKPASSRSRPPQRTSEVATSSVKERALKTSSSLPRTATSSAKQAAAARSPVEKSGPHRPQPLQKSPSAGMSSAKERTLKASSSSMPSQKPEPAAAATCSVKDRASKTSSSISRAATAAAKQPSASPTLKAGRTTTTPTRKSPGSAVSRKKETPPVAAPMTARKQAVVTAGEKDEKEASVWVDKQELISASYVEVPVHDVSEVNSDPLPEIPEPISPPMQASPHGSNADGDDRDREDFDVSSDEQEPVGPSSTEGCLHGEPEVEDDPVQEQQEPSSSPEQASQLTSSVEEGSDRERDDIDVPECEQEHVSTSSMGGHADDEPEASHDVPVHEQQDEPSSPPMQTSELTSSVDESEHDRDDIDVPRDDELLQLQASAERPVAEISSREPGRNEKEVADAEYNQTSPEILSSPARDISLFPAGAQAGNEMIEETRAKLLAKQRSKVRALVGAFETAISLQESDGQTDHSLEKRTERGKVSA